MFSRLNKKYKEAFEKMKGKLVQFSLTLFAGLKFVPSKVQVLMAAIIGKNIEFLNKLKSTSVSSGSIKKRTIVLFTLLGAFGIKIKIWYLALRPTTVVLAVVSTAAISIAALNIYGSGKSIYKKTQVRPVKVRVLPENLRAEYYKQSKKHLLVNGITVPIYVGTGNAPRTLILDLTMLMSNRYLKSFFFEKDFLLKDQLNSNFEPVIPTLPLEEEGKRILKQKIMDETNKLIKRLGIEGEVKDIYFHTIING